MNDIITIRGERELWLDFTHKVKKDRKKVWPVVKPFLRKYVSSDRKQRVLLMLLQQAIRKQLETSPPDTLSQD